MKMCAKVEFVGEAGDLHSAVGTDVHERVENVGDVRDNHVSGLEVATVDTPVAALAYNSKIRKKIIKTYQLVK